MSRPDDNNSLEKDWGFDLSYLVEWDHTGAARPPINDQNRPLVLAALESILLDFRRRDEYLAALKSLCPQGFAHLDALDESLEEQLLNHGLEVATNDQLAQLLLRPVGLCQLADAIRDAFAEAWWPAMRRVGSRLMDEHGVSVPTLSDVMPALAFDPLADMPLSVPLDAGAGQVVPTLFWHVEVSPAQCLWEPDGWSRDGQAAQVRVIWFADDRRLRIVVSGFLSVDAGHAIAASYTGVDGQQVDGSAAGTLASYVELFLPAECEPRPGDKLELTLTTRPECSEAGRCVVSMQLGEPPRIIDFGQLIGQFLAGEQPEREATLLFEAVDADRAVSRLFDQMTLGSVRDLLAAQPTSHAGAVAPSPVVPFVQRQMRLAKSRQLWPLEPLGSREAWKDDILRSNEPVAVRATALETAGTDSPPKARRLTGALQRVADSPLVLRWTGNLPAGFELLGLALTRLQPCGRKPLTIPPRAFGSLLRAIANRPSPAGGDAVQPERAAAALGLALSAASAADRPGIRETETHQGEVGEVVDFSVECNPQRGTVGVRARMPAGVRDDFAVCDVHYTDRGGQPATERRLLRLRASESASSAWSVPQRVALPTPDDCGSAELGFQFRSLRDDDLYLLSAGDLDLLQAEQPALLLPAKKNDAGGFEFAASLPFEREALAAADVAWSLQVARIEKEPADA